MSMSLDCIHTPRRFCCNCWVCSCMCVLHPVSFVPVQALALVLPVSRVVMHSVHVDSASVVFEILNEHQVMHKALGVMRGLTSPCSAERSHSGALVCPVSTGPRAQRTS